MLSFLKGRKYGRYKNWSQVSGSKDLVKMLEYAADKYKLGNKDKAL
jgi:hypothetical protein